MTVEFINQPLIPGQEDPLIGPNGNLLATSDMFPSGVPIMGIAMPPRKHASVVWLQLPNGGAAADNSPLNAYGQMQRSGGEPSVGDWVEWDIALPGVRPANNLMHLAATVLRGSNIGSYRFLLDGVEIMLHDGYKTGSWDFSFVYGNFLTGTAGKHTLRMEVAAKNASSTGHYLCLSQFVFYQSYDV